MGCVCVCVCVCWLVQWSFECFFGAGGCWEFEGGKGQREERESVRREDGGGVVHGKTEKGKCVGPTACLLLFCFRFLVLREVYFTF